MEQHIWWDVVRARLRKKRLDRGLTQTQLSERMGRSQDYVSNLENNVRSTPTLATALLWAGALGCSFELVEDE